jgi:hypothetical protein
MPNEGENKCSGESRRMNGQCELQIGIISVTRGRRRSPGTLSMQCQRYGTSARQVTWQERSVAMRGITD